MYLEGLSKEGIKELDIYEATVEETDGRKYCNDVC